MATQPYQANQPNPAQVNLNHLAKAQTLLREMKEEIAKLPTQWREDPDTALAVTLATTAQQAILETRKRLAAQAAQASQENAE